MVHRLCLIKRNIPGIQCLLQRHNLHLHPLNLLLLLTHHPQIILINHLLHFLLLIPHLYHFSQLVDLVLDVGVGLALFGLT